MLGWEFPPYNSGGLGIACEGLAKSFAKHGMEVTFVMPKAPVNANSDHAKLIVAAHKTYSELPETMTIKKVPALLRPYMTSSEYADEKGTLSYKMALGKDTSGFDIEDQYGSNLYQEVMRYSQKVFRIAEEEDFDVIHAHDWMAFQAGIAAKEASGKPLVVHIHNTAFDRSGGNPSQYEYDIEREGFHKADKVVSISHFVANTLRNHYGVPDSKIEVVHNGVDVDKYSYQPTSSAMSKTDKIVLFAGRVTLQKGPDYFVKAASEVVKHMDNVKFVMAGSGDMLNRSINMAAELGVANKFIFPGRYTKEEGVKLMNMADVFVMPSVAEPFGLVPLEAMLQKTPTIISKQSGVSEVVQNSLKVDFWDTTQLANKICSVLKYGALNEQLSEYGSTEANNLTWDSAGQKCKALFHSLINCS